LRKIPWPRPLTPACGKRTSKKSPAYPAFREILFLFADNSSMDLNFNNLLSQLLISCAGMGFVLYGKKGQHLWPLIGGIALCTYPYFVTNIWALWALALAIMGGLYFLREH